MLLLLMSDDSALHKVCSLNSRRHISVTIVVMRWTRRTWPTPGSSGTYIQLAMCSTLPPRSNNDQKNS